MAIGLVVMGAVLTGGFSEWLVGPSVLVSALPSFAASIDSAGAWVLVGLPLLPLLYAAGVLAVERRRARSRGWPE